MAASLGSTGEPPVDLLPLALSRPTEALQRARALLEAGPSAATESVARQAIGVVLREYGDIDAAVGELRTALRLAGRARSAERQADVLSTLGVTLVFAGRTAAGLRALDGAVDRATGHPRGRNLFRRGAVLLILGRHEQAMTDLDGAITALRAAGDRVWEARVLNERAVGQLALGSPRRSAADLARAQELFDATGQELESVEVQMNRGLLALRLGELPEALTRLDEADEGFERLGAVEPGLSAHRCAALLAAGLPDDALRHAEEAIGRLERSHGPPTKRAELLLTAATCAASAGQPEAAFGYASEAGRLFGRQHRPWWAAHARLARIQAAVDAGRVDVRLAAAATRCVAELTALSSPELPAARLAAGRVALALGRHRAAGEQLAAAADARRHGPPLARATGWLAEAIRADAAGDPRRVLQACGRGLDLIDEHRAMLGSAELRAQATRHGAELALLGQQQAARLDRPELLLAWSERWRAIALAVPEVRPPTDQVLQRHLAALRAVTGRLGRAEQRGLPTTGLRREQQRLEREVRNRALRARGVRGVRGAGARPSRPAGFDVRTLLDALGPTTLVQLVDLRGELHALVCGEGRVRRVLVGPTARAAQELRFARSTLSRVAHGLSAGTSARREARSRGGRAAGADRVGSAAGELLARLEATGALLGRALLGPAVDLVAELDAARGAVGPLVFVPPGALHAVPWGIVPGLRQRPVQVAPSAASWLNARRALAAATSADGRGRVVLVRGPGLASQGAEVAELARLYADLEPVVLEGGTATAGRVLAAIDGAELVHIAAHGSYRADSPLFSSLRLDDGPLTVYDLERLRRGPRRLVLSSCDSAVVAPAGADEVLGLASSLIPLGTAGVVASVVPVNDASSVPLMVGLHRSLRTGRSLAEALLAARHDAVAGGPGTAPDPVSAATAWSFVALGAG